MIFTKRNPVYSGIDVRETGPITCGCEGKKFSKVSALCQHLESGACCVPFWGPDVVERLIDMMRKGVWQYTRRGNVKCLSLEDVVDEWGDYAYC